MEKTCIKCGQTKPITEFWKQKINRDGYTGTCRACGYKERAARPGYLQRHAAQERARHAAKRAEREAMRKDIFEYYSKKNANARIP